MLITIATAILAKQKGFDKNVENFLEKETDTPGFVWKSPTYYPNGDGIKTLGGRVQMNFNGKFFPSISDFEIIGHLYDSKNNPTEKFSAPMQFELHKWLREKHQIHIQPIYHKTKKYSVILNDECENTIGDMFGEYFDTHELALEAALINALKLLPDVST